MWLAAVTGLYSVVKKGAPGEYQVRARVKGDLENLCGRIGFPNSRIITTPAGDYAFRLVVSEEELGLILESLRASIEYPNFKNAVARVPGQEKHEIMYHKWWADAAKLQPWPPYCGPRRDVHEARLADSGGRADDVEPRASTARKTRGSGRKTKSEELDPPTNETSGV
jgi:hypothetical protein